MSVSRGLLVAIVVLAGSLVPAGAGSDRLKDWAEGDKVGKKVWFAPGHANVKKLKEAGAPPKRVGLISFYIFDTGSFEFNAMANTYGGVYQETFGLNAKGANTFASEFAKLGVPALKAEFEERGMQLLIPIEFLDTPERKQAYLDFVLPMSGLAKGTMSIANWVSKTPKANGAADGFETIATHLWQDAKMLDALEGLRVKLGLDAVAVVANLTSSNPESVILSGIILEMYGPNPVPRPENKLAATGYSTGIPYVKGNFGKGFKGVEVVLWKKGVVKETLFEGYDVVLKGLGEATLDEFKEFWD